ncbi:S-adenosylmethionine mitochondrial carrier protein homolog [Sitodiplosis mosellana]|uniref:S-adenosylmethionine mitochondrial carrier protein homolog n=1 Tax=Sitodiplosis mosellana TaxID=263140 RepID=UPI0024443EB7|nr:S-adenosylmethionine mitochondrial carrier protein homolog [Sitodiplosis mosellana]
MSLEDANGKVSAKNYLYLTSLISGGMAGLVVDVMLFPIDTIKTRLQSEKRFWRAGGFRGIYNGLSPAAAGSVPSAALFFCTYESMKKLLAPYAHGQQTHFVHMSSAAIAEVVACLVRVPVEIAKQRRQVQSTQYRHVSASKILVQAYQTEGIFRGLYRGFGATILREIPFSFIQYPLWEYLKLHWTSVTHLPLTFVSVAVCGAIAGGIAAGVTTPLDVVKTRIMLATRNGEKRKGVHSILHGIYKENGIKGVFAGFIPRVMWITIGGAIFFGSYDLTTKIVTKHLF